MFSFAKNERGIRLASAAIVLLPVVCLILAVCRSAILSLLVLLLYSLLATCGFIGFLCECAEEDEPH